MLVLDVIFTGIFFSFFVLYLDHISREIDKIYQGDQKI